MKYVTLENLQEYLANMKKLIPSNNNTLTNGAGYQTASDVQTAITNALASYGDGDSATF